MVQRAAPKQKEPNAFGIGLLRPKQDTTESALHLEIARLSRYSCLVSAVSADDACPTQIMLIIGNYIISTYDGQTNHPIARQSRIKNVNRGNGNGDLGPLSESWLRHM